MDKMTTVSLLLSLDDAMTLRGMAFQALKTRDDDDPEWEYGGRKARLLERILKLSENLANKK